MDMDRTFICKFYFRLGFKYKYILRFLAEQHGIVISMRTLKRTGFLKGAGLRRQKSKTDILEAALFIPDKISSCADYGHRWMHLQCTQSGLNVPRYTERIEYRDDNLEYTPDSPTSYETRSYRIEVDQDKVDVCKTECIFRQNQICDEDIWDLCGIYMKENALSSPTSLDAAIALYKILKDLFHQDI